MDDDPLLLFARDWRIDRRAATPAYAQIEQRLVALIGAGRLRVGDRVPAERDLARRLGVSRTTIRSALSALAERGVLERDVGRGTFVARAKVDHDLTRVAGFTEQVTRFGLAATARIRALTEAPAPAAIAAELAIEPGAPTFRIERLRLGNAEPLTLEDSWVPAQRFPGLLDHDLRGSLYAVMRDAYDRQPVRAIERLEPTIALPHQARALGVGEGSALMLVQRTAYSADDTPVEHAHDHHRGDRARFVVEVPARSSSEAPRERGVCRLRKPQAH